MGTVLTVVLYYRVSTEEQGKQGYSIPEQRAACLARAQVLARAAGAELRTYEWEDHVGGDWLERPALDQVREFIARNKVDYFICLDPDRFSRKLVHQLLIAEEIERAGTKLEFVQHTYRKDPDGQAFFAIRGVFSELEKAKILERTRRGRSGKIAAGGIPHWFQPYGYRYTAGVKSGQPLEIKPEEAEWVRRMYQWCIEGAPAEEIARRLTALGVPTPRRRRPQWNRSTVHDILRNPVYRGEARLNRVDAAGIQALRQFPPEWRRQRGLKLTFRSRPPSEWRTVRVPPIVDPETWEAAQRVLDQHRTVRYTGSDRWLRGLGRCGLCGGPIYYGAHGAGGRQYMTCRNRWQRRCPLPNKLATWVEEAVWATLREWILDPQLIAHALESSAGNPEELARVAAELEQVRRRLEEKSAEIERVGLLFARGLWDEEQTERTLRQLRAERDELHRLEAELQDRLRHLQPRDTSVRVAKAAEYREQLAGVLDQLGPEERRRIALELMDHFVLHPTPHMHRPRVTVIPRGE
ncbi:recombinase family protein [Caldinitratiruptor microaerophilus]|uniref:DNA recombinase n=1 Tax=Caldinitratiruptor microaerophilus TaxID=671077 RepID=A0AA35CJ76_9FIRM|nr:recombinase family protein [Caldinitratiruptor microaerophilus]BDG60255.1 putative DNA recombinase [Caldinitratiruptor microaerophilus]